MAMETMRFDRFPNTKPYGLAMAWFYLQNSCLPNEVDKLLDYGQTEWQLRRLLQRCRTSKDLVVLFLLEHMYAESRDNVNQECF